MMPTTQYVLISGFWRAQGRANIPEVTVPVDPPETPPTDPDRDPLLVPPDALTTGPRIDVSGMPVISSAEAFAIAESNEGICQGQRISNLRSTETWHADCEFWDCDIICADYGFNGFTYANAELNIPTDANRRTLLAYCNFIGRKGGNEGPQTSALANGYNFTLMFCTGEGAVDAVKMSGANEIYGCFFDKLWHPELAHCDMLQVQRGSYFLIHYNNLRAFNDPASPDGSGGEPSSAVLQTGSALGDLLGFDMRNNWVDGGGFTIRGGADWTAGDGTEYDLEMVFRNNRQGRNFRYGPVTAMGSFDSGRAVSDYDSSNVWDDNGLPVIGS